MNCRQVAEEQSGRWQSSVGGPALTEAGFVIQTLNPRALCYVPQMIASSGDGSLRYRMAMRPVPVIEEGVEGGFTGWDFNA